MLESRCVYIFILFLLKVAYNGIVRSLKFVPSDKYEFKTYCWQYCSINSLAHVCTYSVINLRCLTSLVSNNPCNENQLDKAKGTTRTNCHIYIYSLPTDDGLQICPKHVEVDWRNKLRINNASNWFSLKGCIEMHGQQNIEIEPYTLYFYSFYSLHFFPHSSQFSQHKSLNFNLWSHFPKTEL
jgi:hypothetical protein